MPERFLFLAAGNAPDTRHARLSMNQSFHWICPLAFLATLSSPTLAQGEFLAIEELNDAFPETLVGIPPNVSSVEIQGSHAIAGSSRSGEVRIYVRPAASNLWVSEASFPLIAEIRSVAIFDTFAAVGLLDPDNSTLPGSVQTYRRVNGVWQPDALLTSMGSNRDAFGNSIALSQTSDGSTWMMVGAPRQELGSIEEQGVVFAYQDVGGTWALQEVIEAPSPSPFDRFGRSLSLDRDQLAVGAPFGDPRVVMLHFNGTDWVQGAVLRSGVAGSSTFGQSVDLDGDRVVVSDPNSLSGQGRALLFEGPFTNASVGLPLLPSGPREFYGLDVAVSEELVLVTNLSQPGVPSSTSRVDVYQPLGGGWAQTSSIEGTDSSPLGFGWSIALDGTELIVGDTRRPNPGTGRGAVFLFDLFPAETTTYCTSLPGSSEHPANLWTEGSRSVFANELELRAGPVPDQPGLFFYGLDPAAQPFGGGVLCIAGPPIFRLPIEQADGGILRHRLDLNSPPSAAGQILPGSQWRFQAWFRDPQGGPGATFRTSSAAQLNFVP